MSEQHTHFRAPRQCPVCDARLHVTQLGCDTCGTGISGGFEQCDFCALDARDLDALRAFLGSRGNMKELERHLGVSYPTARARFDEIVRKLGIPVGSEPAPIGEARPGGTLPGDALPGDALIGDDESRLATLRALAAGQLDVEAAKRALGAP